MFNTPFLDFFSEEKTIFLNPDINKRIKEEIQD